jgi:hypothetical protein
MGRRSIFSGSAAATRRGAIGSGAGYVSLATMVHRVADLEKKLGVNSLAQFTPS